MRSYAFILASFIVILSSISTYAKQGIRIQGKVVDQNGMSIEQAVIAIRPIGQSTILTFQRSNENGNFEISLSSQNLDSIELEIRHLGYHTQIKKLKSPFEFQNIRLETKENKLEEIKVGAPPIYRRNDTLKYQVNSFLTGSDRVIADVLQKLPGIEISDGKIFYQGRPIQKFMVNELDLMQGQYGLINQNLPAGVVSEVQILENHQPIKALDSILFSDRASLNLVVKNTSLTGLTDFAAGANEEKFLWEFNSTPIIIQKNLQTLISLQSNNTGLSPLENLKDYYAQSNVIIIQPGGIDKKDPTYLRLIDYSPPRLEKKLWLNNLSHLASSHILKKISTNTELRGQLTYSRHTEIRNSSNKKEYIGIQPQHQFSEKMKNDYMENFLEGSLGIETNSDKAFIKNVTRFRKSQSKDNGTYDVTGNPRVNQNIDYKGNHISNQLQTLFRKGKNFFNFSSQINYGNTPQHLVIESEKLSLMNLDLDNSNKLNQYARFKTFESYQTLSSSHQLWKFRYTNEIQYESYFQKLNSNLIIFSDDSGQYKPDDFVNDVKISSHKLAYIPTLNYITGGLNLTLKSPIKWNLRNSYLYGNKTRFSRPTLDPEIIIRYKIDRNHDLSGLVSINRQLGLKNTFHPGYIVMNYNSISSTPDQNQINDQQAYQMRYEYQNIKTNQIIMANLTGSYSQNQSDFLIIHDLDSLGKITTTYLNQPSNNNNYYIAGVYSHYFTALKSGIKLNLQHQTSYNDYQINNTPITRKNQNLTSELELRSQYVKNWSFFYKLGYRANYAHSQQITYNFQNWTQNFEAHGTFDEIHQLSLLTQHYAYDNMVKQHWNMNLSYQYKIKNWKTDLKLSVMNLLNNQEYLSRNFTNIQYTESLYHIRPLQILLGLQWLF